MMSTTTRPERHFQCSIRMNCSRILLPLLLLLSLLPLAVRAFTIPLRLSSSTTQQQQQQLWAKKNKKPNVVDFAAWDEDDDDDDRLSKKELKQQLKQKQQGGGAVKEQAAAATTATTATHASKGNEEEEEEQQEQQLSKKELMLKKALAMEAAEEAAQVDDVDANNTQLSKKEMKALQKKQEKMAEKLAKKAAKKAKKNGVVVVMSDDDDDTDGTDATATSSADAAASPPLNGAAATTATTTPPTATLEDKIRKERPPPRIRVMETTNGGQPGYTSLRLEHVGITFRNQHVLEDVTWGVQTGDRIGLVGHNGAGKTTQIRILAGELEPTTGDVVKSSRDVRVAVLRQEFVDELVVTRSLRMELQSVFERENAILRDMQDVEEALASASDDDTEHMQTLLDRMQELQELGEDQNVFAIESRVQKIMDLMGFTEDEGDDAVSTFSGGWKMRIGLGKVLLRDPNVLLLDEPTNNLDVESIEWLEDFLRQQNIPMVIVSHDREFLDQVCTKIVDAEGGICTEYDGNYSRFLLLKKARMDSWQAAYNAQEKKIKEERAWMNKFKVKQPQAVKQRQAKLDKLMKSSDYVKKPPFVGKPFRFRFPDAPRLSPEVADIKGLSHSYSNEQSRNRLFENVDLFIEKGDRIAVVGPNGSGKSTLLRLLVGRETPESGSAQIVGQNVVVNYFEQHQADALDLEKTVLETIQGASSGQSYNELRALLGQFLFKGDAVDKKVANLSGGEKARLSLCCMMLTPANLLILDEPTNHIDVAAKEMLEEALQHFTGSVIVVSHDRFFISRVATSIVAIEDKKLTKYQGDYKFYMEKSEKMKERLEARYVPGLQRIESAPIVDLEAIQNAGKKKSFGGSRDSHLVTRKDKGVKNAKRLQPK